MLAQITMNTIKLIEKVRSGVAEIAVERNRQALGTGSAFLINGGLITNSHVIKPPSQIDAIRIRFESSDEPIRFLPNDLYNVTLVESPQSELDYAFIKLDEEEFRGRYRFNLGDKESIKVGQNILFLGYPFGMPQLTAHMGYVSSIHDQRGRELIQIDGSVNGGNSGGPFQAGVSQPRG